MAARAGVRSVVVPDDLWAWAKSRAEALQVSVSDLVRQGLEATRTHGPVMEQAGPGVREFAQAVLHGDAGHRAWLLDAAECFLAGKPLPPPPEPDEEEDEDEEPVTARAEYPPGFQVLISGSAAWYRGAWVYAFPASHDDEWVQAIRLIEEIGNPDENPAAWDAVSNQIKGWLRPRRRDE